MERHLLLLRHAKAKPVHGSEADRDRPLLPEGLDAAALVGRFLGAAGYPPDLVLTSPAERARATALLAREASGRKCPLREVPGLYQGSPRGVLQALRSEGGDAETVLLVGHEPTWSDLASSLVGGASIQLPTAALVDVSFDLESWSEARAGGGVLRWMVTPKLLAILEKRSARSFKGR